MSKKHYTYCVNFVLNDEPFSILCTSFDRAAEAARFIFNHYKQRPICYAFFPSEETLSGYAISTHKSDLLQAWIAKHLEAPIITKV